MALSHPHCPGLKRGSKGAETPSKRRDTQQQQPPPPTANDSTDSNSNTISPVPSEEEDEGLEPCQSESYHWCEEDDLTSSEAVTSTSTEKTLASSAEADQHHSAEEYVELAKEADTNLAHIDMEDFQSEQIRSLLIEYRQRNSRPLSRSQSPLSQDDCSLTDCGSLCKSGPLFSPQRVAPNPGKDSIPPDYSTDSLNLMERDECWLLQEEAGETSQLLCRANMTNYTLAWSSASGGTDQDLEYNEPGTSSSGSEQSRDWSSSGSAGGGRVAPPIPPWPAGARQQQHCGMGTWSDLKIDPTTNLQRWANRPNNPPANNRKPSPVAARKSRKDCPADHPSSGRTELTNFRDTVADKGDCSSSNPTLSDMDNGNEKASSRTGRHRPVFTKSSTPPSAPAGLSLLQIYMRQKSQSSIERENYKKSGAGVEEIASGGGEGWVEEYPSSADEKLGLESITSSLADVDDEGVDDEVSDNDELCENARSLTLTDVSDIEQTSIQIDAVPFNTVDPQQHSPSSTGSSSLDKLIAKIKPFELGLSPASMEEHWNFEKRLQHHPASSQDKSCQATIHPPSSATHEESTCTDPIKPEAYVIFPSYSLPDLSFLKKHDYTWIGDVLLSPQNLPPPSRLGSTVVPQPPPKRNFDELKKCQLGHIKDWESLDILLPEEIRHQINSAKPTMRTGNSSAKPRPKSCDHTVILRESKKPIQRPVSLRGSSARLSDAGLILPTVPQSPTGTEVGPPPLPKRTASLPQSPAPLRQRRPAEPTSPGRAKTAHPLSSPTSGPKLAGHGFTMRKTVSFGEHLSGGFLKMGNQNRPLSLSHWSGGSTPDIDSVIDEVQHTSFSMERKEELVRNVSLAAAQLCKVMNQPARGGDTQAKLIARCVSGQLSPAIYQLLSDGLLPNVNTFFGQVVNSVWRVVEASVKKGPVLPWIEELVLCLSSEENLPEGPVRFGVFINELINMGGLDWWLDNLSTKEAILRRHYAPNGFLYLCHTTTRSLMEELRTALRPLASLPLDTTAVQPAPAKTNGGAPVTKPVASPSSPAKTAPSNNKAILKSPVRSKTQRPMSYVQNTSPNKTGGAGPPHQYRRTQSQHSGLAPAKKAGQQQVEKAEVKVEELRQKWESLCRPEKTKSAEPAVTVNTGNLVRQSSNPSNQQQQVESTVKSRIPRPVFRSNK